MSRLGDSETVFQHLKAYNFAIGDREHDREVRLDDLARSLEFGLERAKDHGRLVAGQNIEDVKADALNQARESLTKSVIAALPDFRPIHGRTPVSPAISHSTLSLNNLAISAGSVPLPMLPRNSWARRRLSF